MKVLTLTTQYVNNFGALLQCYALCKFINNQHDTECRVIQYYHEHSGDSWKIIKKPGGLRDVLKMVYTLFNVRLTYDLLSKQRKMRRFLKEYIPVTESQYYSLESIKANPPIADAYVCGSDQIWNMIRPIKGRLAYFLDFVPEGKKRISYAASIADPWTEEHINQIASSLAKFDAVSIREKGNLEQVKSIYPNATVVIDPVFLLDRTDWDKIKNTEKCIEEPYILCYFLSVTEQMVKTVEKVRQLTGYKLVHLNINALDKFHSDVNIRAAGPRDFVGLISKASFVITNSFHCSAFSVIYRKDFIFCPKGNANERIVNLQEVFGLGNVMMSKEKLESLSKEDLSVDYSNCDKLGGEFLEYSKKFLLDNIYGKTDKSS